MEHQLTSSDFLLSALDTTQDALYLIDADLQFHYVNKAACRMLGYSREELLQMGVLDIDPTITPETLAKLEKDAHDNVYPAFESVHLTKSGVRIPVEITRSLLSFNGRNYRMSIVRDIRERKAAEEKLRLSASVFTNAQEGIIITDSDARIVDVNDAFCRISGYSRDEIIGENPRLLQSGRQNAQFYETMWSKLTQHGLWSGELWNRRKNGNEYAEHLTISVISDTQGSTNHYVGLIADITKAKRYEQQLEKIAHYDVLTGVPNRFLLIDRLQQAMAYAKRHNDLIAVVYLDMDGFKEVNDRHGHAAGDTLLIEISRKLQKTLRDEDTLARLGGDEFIIILRHLDDTSDAEMILQRVLETVSSTIRINDYALNVSASLGVTFYPQEEAVDAEQLIRQSDQSMYNAKQSGKNRYCFFDSEREYAVRTRHRIIHRLTQALENQEFVLHYQPRVNLKTGAVIGVEALIRWNHPENGLLLPARFLPDIHDHFLIVRLGAWVLESAVAQIARWQAEHLSLVVSVNVDAMQLAQENFTTELMALLERHGVSSSTLELEILETSAIEKVEHISRVIEACQETGVRFALDDFGTGYSSLKYLKQLQAHILKIDRSFVSEMFDDPGNIAIIEGIMGLAAAFDRVVIAEGVEDDAHAKRLLELGCEQAQGFAIARAMPPEALPGWIAAWNRKNKKSF